MLLLLDSSGQRLVCAALHDGALLASINLRSASEEARDLGAVCRRLLAESGAEDFSAVAAGCGPGSFIGTRIAVSFANGYAAARGQQLRGFNSVAALLPADEPSVGSAVVRDARREQVYLHLPALGPEHIELVDRGALVEKLSQAGVRSLYAEEVEERPGRPSSLPAELQAWCAAQGTELYSIEALDPLRAFTLLGGAEARDYIEPVYLRGFL